MSFDAHQLDQFVLVGAVVTLCAILAVRLSSRAGLPALLIYLLMGVLLGDRGLGVRFDDASVAHALGFIALALILAEGGLTTSWSDLRPSLPLGTALATLGVVVSIAVVAVVAHYLLGLRWELAVLLGAVTSPTDAAAVFSVLRVVPLPRRITGALEAESGLNDAPTVVLVTLVSEHGLRDHQPWTIVGIILAELVLGAAIGLVVGYAGAWLMRRAALPTSGLYPLAVLCLALLAYAGAAALHESGFAAVYVAALVLGNAELPHRTATRSFTEGIASLAQIGLFVMLGLLLSPGRLSWSTVGMAMVAGAVLTFVARPLSVLACAWAGRLRASEVAFLSWAGLRGAVPVVLTTIPLAAGVVGSEELFDIVFVMVVVLTLVTGPTLPLAARRLGLARPADPRSLEMEIAPMDQIAADLLHLRIVPESQLHGVEIRELRLPRGAVVSLLIRHGESLVPDARTTLRAGDVALVVVPRALREQTERRLRAVSRYGRLAHWLRP